MTILDRSQESRVATQPVVAGRLVAPDQAIEFRKLATLPLPAHPATLDRVPDSSSVEHEETVRPIAAKPTVERAHSIQRRLDVALIFRHLFRGSVGEVGQNGQAEPRIGIGQVMDLEPFQQHRCALRSDQHRRHHDDRITVSRYPFSEVELGQHPRRHEQRDEVIDDPDRQFTRRHDQHQEETQDHAGGCGCPRGQG